MKKFLFVPVLALAAVSLSCSKDNIAGEGGENASGKKEVIVFSEPQIEIGAVSAGTKTTLENSSIKWEEVEYISLFNADGSNTWTYELTAGAGTTSATFTAQGEPQTGFTYAIYPQNSNVPSGAGIAANLATEQTYSEDGFPTLYPMGAKTEDGKTFVFENLATVLRLPLKGTGTIASVTIESVGREPLAGAATVDFSGETPVMTAAAEGASASVTLNCAESWPSINESEPVYFNFILFPGTYSQGFRFTINESNGNSTTVTTGGTAVELVAGTFKNFDSPLTIDTPQGWNLTGSFNDMNWGSSWIDMQDAHGLVYLENQTIPANALFKIRSGENEWYGGWGNSDEETVTISPDQQSTVWKNTNGGNANLTVAEGTYNIYFDYWSPNNDGSHLLWVMTEGTPFGIVGSCTGSNWNTNIPMVIENGWLVAKGVEFAEQGGFKIRFGETWDAIFELGSDNEETVREIGSPVTVIRKRTDYHSQNITVPAGTYDIYLDFNRVDSDQYKQTVWVMPAGEVPAE